MRPIESALPPGGVTMTSLIGAEGYADCAIALAQ
jgi:hypothetical protein